MGIVELRVGERVGSLYDTLSSWAYENTELHIRHRLRVNFKDSSLSGITISFYHLLFH